MEQMKSAGVVRTAYLQIPVNDLFLVAVMSCAQNLSEFRSGFLLLHPSMNHKIIIQFATGCHLHDQKQGKFGFDDFIEFCDVWMVQHFHDADFAVQFGELLFVERCFVNYFYRDLNKSGTLMGKFRTIRGVVKRLAGFQRFTSCPVSLCLANFTFAKLPSPRVFTNT